MGSGTPVKTRKSNEIEKPKEGGDIFNSLQKCAEQILVLLREACGRDLAGGNVCASYLLTTNEGLFLLYIIKMAI